eukprot:Rhum_TRINITY_DN21258_c0_g1::Rhum_TRINITY_DN21258_c0_g1_i1::g.173595::m.173595
MGRVTPLGRDGGGGVRSVEGVGRGNEADERSGRVGVRACYLPPRFRPPLAGLPPLAFVLPAATAASVRMRRFEGRMLMHSVTSMRLMWSRSCSVATMLWERWLRRCCAAWPFLSLPGMTLTLNLKRSTASMGPTISMGCRIRSSSKGCPVRWSMTSMSIAISAFSSWAASAAFFSSSVHCLDGVFPSTLKASSWSNSRAGFCSSTASASSTLSSAARPPSQPHRRMRSSLSSSSWSLYLAIFLAFLFSARVFSFCFVGFSFLPAAADSSDGCTEGASVPSSSLASSPACSSSSSARTSSLRVSAFAFFSSWRSFSLRRTLSALLFFVAATSASSSGAAAVRPPSVQTVPLSP